jgi:hypothetical protein
LTHPALACFTRIIVMQLSCAIELFPAAIRISGYNVRAGKGA